MKPGMQRDLLVTFWVLFDDLVNDDPKSDAAPNAATPAPSPGPGESAPHDSGGRRSS